MGKLNRALYTGDADSVPLEFNGITKQLIDGNAIVIDCLGLPIASTDIENAAQQALENFGNPTVMFSNSKVFTDFGKQYAGSQRFIAPDAPAGRAGTPITGYNTQVGTVGFESDIFCKRGDVPPAAATSAKAPAAPTIAPGNIGANSASLWLASDAGNYKYQVTSVNAFGESAPSAISGAQALVAGQSVDVVITDGGGVYPATGYKVYRTEKGGSTAYYIGYRTNRAKTGGAYINTTTYTDINSWRPHTFQALMLDMTPQSLTFRQLSPMIRMPLAIVAPSIRWMQLLYGTPIVFAPKKNILFKNVGVAAA
jgi:hypothetical protein